MGLSFAGPTAPPSRRPRLLPVAGRYLLAAVAAIALTALAASAMFVTTAPAWLSCLIQPFSFLLLPGFLLEAIPRNAYFFSSGGVACLAAIFYFLLFARLLRPRSL